MKNKNYVFKSAQTITVGALLTAACFVLAYLAKSVFGTSSLRFTIENLPIFIGSFFYGPVMGAVIGVCADLLSCLYAGMAPMPLISVGACLIGLISGVLFRFLLKNSRMTLRIIISVFVSHIIGSITVKTLALYPIFGNIVFFRIPIYIGIAVIESAVLIFIMKNKALVRQIEKTKDKK